MFVCICCGAEAPNAYIQYSNDIIYFQLCKYCGRVVDKYFEYDFTIIAIDLLVLKIEAYRHILRNIEVPRLIHLLLLSCILTGFLGWICTENFDDFDSDVINVAVNSDLYFYILMKMFLTLVFGVMLLFFSRVIRIKTTIVDISKLLMLSNMCSLIGLLMFPWKDILSAYLCHLYIFAPLLSFFCTLPTTIPSFRALTNASCVLSSTISIFSCASVFVIECFVIKMRFID